MREFEVFGPSEVPVERRKQWRTIAQRELAAFWSDNSTIGDAVGCYMFGIRTGGGIRPYYVGKATKSFRQECFTPHKLNHYNRAMADYRSGTPVMFFVVPRSRASVSSIGNIERFLIETGVARNPDLCNVVGTKQADWSIRGVIRSDQGGKSRNARLFKRMMAL
jgi:hypothetical protein